MRRFVQRSKHTIIFSAMTSGSSQIDSTKNTWKEQARFSYENTNNSLMLSFHGLFFHHFLLLTQQTTVLMALVILTLYRNIQQHNKCTCYTHYDILCIKAGNVALLCITVIYAFLTKRESYRIIYFILSFLSCNH